MKGPSLPWVDLVLWQPHRCWHVAWFLYGCAEREHVLNVDACMRWWLQAFTPLAAPGKLPLPTRGNF